MLDDYKYSVPYNVLADYVTLGSDWLAKILASGFKKMDYCHHSPDSFCAISVGPSGNNIVPGF